MGKSATKEPAMSQAINEPPSSDQISPTERKQGDDRLPRIAEEAKDAGICNPSSMQTDTSFLMILLRALSAWGT
jgi:hypothetical protein